VVPPKGQAHFTKNISSLSNFYVVFRFLRSRFNLPDDDDDLGSELINEVVDGDEGGSAAAAVRLVWLVALLFTAEKMGVMDKKLRVMTPLSRSHSLPSSSSSTTKAKEGEKGMGMQGKEAAVAEDKKVGGDEEENGDAGNAEDESVDEGEFSSVAEALDHAKRCTRKHLMEWCRQSLRPFQVSSRVFAVAVVGLSLSQPYHDLYSDS
jgi:hypothetical protein